MHASRIAECIAEMGVCLQAVGTQHKSQITSMDDLIEHIKSIHDRQCNHVSMSYLEYMQHHYTYGGKIGLQDMTDDFPQLELIPWNRTLINLFYARPFAADATKTKKKQLVNDFSHLVQGLMALDDAEWRPVAMLAMRKADDCQKGNHQVHS